MATELAQLKQQVQGYQLSRYGELQAAQGSIQAFLRPISSTPGLASFDYTTTGLWPIRPQLSRQHFGQWELFLNEEQAGHRYHLHIPAYPDGLSRIPLQAGGSIISAEIVPVIDADKHRKGTREYVCWLSLGAQAVGWDQRLVIPLGSGDHRGGHFVIENMVQREVVLDGHLAMAFFRVIRRDQNGRDTELFTLTMRRE